MAQPAQGAERRVCVKKAPCNPSGSDLGCAEPTPSSPCACASHGSGCARRRTSTCLSRRWGSCCLGSMAARTLRACPWGSTRPGR